MTESLKVPSPDGEIEANLYLPDQPGPLVVFYMDAFGIRPALQSMALRLVSAGYAVLLPNLYWRTGPYAPFNAATTFHDAPERARILGLMNAVQQAKVGVDTVLLLNSLSTHPQIRRGPVGLLGYCMGGRQGLFAAAHLGDRAAALGSIHGGGLVRPGPDSPHLGAPRIRARCYFAVADADAACTPADLEVLSAALSAANVDFEVELYPGALHGFAAPDMSVFNPRASDHHWDKVLALFGATLWAEPRRGVG